jgi:predicted acyltransferase
MSDQVLPPNKRVLAIDVYRGFVMFLMMAEAVHFADMASELRGNPVWDTLHYHQSHVQWRGCSLHDLIQPSFSFLVGTALCFSLANRQARGQSKGFMFVHAAWRALILILLGVFLRSMHSPQTYWTFEDTLSQIGLGYLPLFALAWLRPVWWWVTAAVILVGYWGAFAQYPVDPNFDYTKVGVPANWQEHATNLNSLAAHWNKNSNLAWRVDTWFLNLFPREKTFAFNDGGYSTLSFIPTLATMILGLIAGGWLKELSSTSWKLQKLILTGLACLAIGLGLDYLGICPNVKRIWTPSWTLFSGGCCFLLLSVFYCTTDVPAWSAWSFPLRVIGMNSIAAYCLADGVQPFIIQSLKIHLGKDFFAQWGKPYEPIILGAVVLVIFWLILFWMYRRKIFLRI